MSIQHQDDGPGPGQPQERSAQERAGTDPAGTVPQGTGAGSVPSPDRGPEAAGPEAAGHPAGPRILIVEDEPMEAELAKRLLARSGMAVSTVVVDTLDAFTEQLSSFRPDLILSDFSLRGFTGADTLKIAQERCPQVPVIIWSGALGDEAAVDLIKHGATDYVLKDRPARLPSAVDRALGEARQRARLAQLESQLGEAQRLASLGRLGAAEQVVARTRRMLGGDQGDQGDQISQVPSRATAPSSAAAPPSGAAPPSDEGPG